MTCHGGGRHTHTPTHSQTSPPTSEHSAVTASQHRNNAELLEKRNDERKSKKEDVKFCRRHLVSRELFRVPHVERGRGRRSAEETTTLHFAFRHLIHISCLCESLVVNFLHFLCAPHFFLRSFGWPGPGRQRRGRRRRWLETTSRAQPLFQFIVATNTFVYILSVLCVIIQPLMCCRLLFAFSV